MSYGYGEFQKKIEALLLDEFPPFKKVCHFHWIPPAPPKKMKKQILRWGWWLGWVFWWGVV
jgi:hypothetical protein